jgi:hypothetical protein
MRNRITGNLLAGPGEKSNGRPWADELGTNASRRGSRSRQCIRVRHVAGKGGPLIPQEVNWEVVRDEESVLGARRFSI